MKNLWLQEVELPIENKLELAYEAVCRAGDAMLMPAATEQDRMLRKNQIDNCRWFFDQFREDN